MNTIQQLEQKNNELSNLSSYKFEYIKGISALKLAEPVPDAVDYYETVTNADGEEVPQLVEVPKPHKEWQDKLTNLEAGLTATKAQIVTVKSEIETLEEELMA